MNKISKTALLLNLALSIAPKTYAANIDMNTAHIQAMDKITGRVSELNIPVNGLANFGTFSILVRKCVTKSPEETPENTAFIDVVDNYKSQNPVNIFKGWMFSSTPGINGIEHPIYDIWLLKCYNSDASKHQVLNEEQLKFRDELPMLRQEKQEQNVKLSVLDDEIEPLETDVNEAKNKSELDTSAVSIDEQKTETKEETENEIIQIDIDEKATDITEDNNTQTEETIKEEFVAEGEELVTETIVIDNDIVAQDEETQKAIAEKEEIVEEIIIDEIEE